jgi:L-threonylcarbamoyladenylate synthase
MTIRLKIDPLNPDPKALAEAVKILRSGGVVAFPTETFYGLGADAHQEAAVEKIFRLKGRISQNPISVIVDSERAAVILTEEMPAAAKVLMQRFWPGPLTLLLRASPSVLPRLTAGTGKIGVRISSNRVACFLAKGLAGPLTATSANLSGERECSTADEVMESFGDRLDAVIDAGKTTGGLGSTILDVTVSPPLVRREGVVSRTDLSKALGGALPL